MPPTPARRAAVGQPCLCCHKPTAGLSAGSAHTSWGPGPKAPRPLPCGCAAGSERGAWQVSSSTGRTLLGSAARARQSIPDPGAKLPLWVP